jgi:hypothetical protein
MATTPSNPSVPLQRPSNRPTVTWLLLAVSIWLWLWTLFAWEIDSSSAQFVLDNLKARSPYLGTWLATWFYWVVALSFVLGALLAWRLRSEAIWAILGLALPSVLLSCWYVTRELPARTAVMGYLLHEQQQRQAAEARRQ